MPSLHSLLSRVSSHDWYTERRSRLFNLFERFCIFHISAAACLCSSDQFKFLLSINNVHEAEFRPVSFPTAAQKTGIHLLHCRRSVVGSCIWLIHGLKQAILENASRIWLLNCKKLPCGRNLTRKRQEPLINIVLQQLPQLYHECSGIATYTI